jgi:hypothetical protein
MRTSLNMTAKIDSAGDVYQFVEQVKVASQQRGEIGLYEQLNRAMHLGSSGLEILGAVRQTVSENRGEIERLLGPDGGHTEVFEANGTAERDAALVMLEQIPEILPMAMTALVLTNQ